MRISDWSSDVCSSDLASKAKLNHCSPWWSLSFLGRTDTAMDDLLNDFLAETAEILAEAGGAIVAWEADPADRAQLDAIFRFVHTIKGRSEEHTSELQSLMRISYAVFC